MDVIDLARELLHFLGGLIAGLGLSTRLFALSVPE